MFRTWISGGTMERPALQRLLADIRQKKIDVVVVYKIDRLTRSLADFSKMVEVFEAAAVSFVSITQQFNTTTSMGRLTLNILLSFAQFEREVTAERIRDKIAASKKKGMWMGGVVSLGYRVDDRKLVIDDSEAITVRYLFNTYLELKSVRDLVDDANRSGLRSKNGQASFTRGALYHLLSNPIYIGKIRHDGQLYDGEHAGIVGPQLFADVQQLLVAQAANRSSQRNRQDVHLLTGIVFDETGDRLSPTHARKLGKRYRSATATTSRTD
ncbi:recombinase family protein [Mesorhizobium sp. Root552]|uniref:recombinase family protein n=1 Tax=Mesorhizobium sp. Root552 TaxID=1736555 RepID=UPI0009EC6571|nr:recombinase family protein [Mesorhizobium sp. Root552]